VNALAAHLAHDAFGIARAYPVLGHPSRGAGPRLVGRVGGRMAFGHPVDVRDWEYALERNDAHVMTYLVPLDWAGRALPSLAIPDELVVVARVHEQSLELAHSDVVWQRGDHAVVLSRVGRAEAEAMLDDVAVGKGRSGL
jgi:hypothetical protein